MKNYSCFLLSVVSLLRDTDSTLSPPRSLSPFSLVYKSVSFSGSARYARGASGACSSIGDGCRLQMMCHGLLNSFSCLAVAVCPLASLLSNATPALRTAQAVRAERTQFEPLPVVNPTYLIIQPLRRHRTVAWHSRGRSRIYGTWKSESKFAQMRTAYRSRSLSPLPLIFPTYLHSSTLGH